MTTSEKQLLREKLATLHDKYLEDAEPYIRRLASLEALDPPRPVVSLEQLPPELRERRRRQLGIDAGVILEQHAEDIKVRIQQLERENQNLRQLLRLVDGIPPGTALPAYLHERVKAVRQGADE